jgi:carbonic anhydrase
LAIDSIRLRSPVLADLEKKGSIQVSGAMYSVANGVVTFIS